MAVAHTVRKEAPPTATIEAQRWQAVSDMVAKIQPRINPAAYAQLDLAERAIYQGGVSQQGEKIYDVKEASGQVCRVTDDVCDCAGRDEIPGHHCQHWLAAVIYQRLAPELRVSPPPATQDTDPDPDPDPDSEAQDNGFEQLVLEDIDPRWLVLISGKPFIFYAGLLCMAHERGLVSLRVKIVFQSEALVIARAIARFQDGRVFEDFGDATLENVAPYLQPSFRRMAGTRAKARVLRDALNIGIVALEELPPEMHDAIVERERRAKEEREQTKPPTARQQGDWCEEHQTHWEVYSRNGRTWQAHQLPGAQWCNKAKRGA